MAGSVLLWVPGQRTFFLPSEPPVLEDLWPPAFQPIVDVPVERLRNTFLTPEWITREALKVLRDNLDVMKQINQHYEVAIPAGVGLAINLRKPPRFTMTARQPELIDGRPTVVLRPGEELITIKRS